jgi:translation initiation factor 2D
MFQKPDSASLSGKKKQALDTPVRKSDRRKARNAASAFFARYNEEGEDAAAVEAMLDNVFLQGSLVIRKLTHHAQFQATVHLYLRGPTDSDAIKKSADNNEDAPLTIWPYTKTIECVWMTVDVGPNTPPRDCPSVALLSVMQNTDALPPVLVPSHASKFICRGAHVMRAGMLSIPEGAAEGSIVAIKAYGNPQPFAVGMLNSTTQADPTSGIGVDVWMCYGDDVYRTTTAAIANIKDNDNGSAAIINSIGGAPFDNGHYGNVGFLEGKFVRPIVSMSDSDSEDDEEANEEKESSEEVAEVLSKVEIDTQDVGADSSAGDDNDVPSVPSPDEESDLEEEPSISPDDLLHLSTCQAMVNLKDKELPMAASVFYANHVLPNRPTGTTIQLKQTSFKKFGTYLLHQQDCGLLKVAEDKKDNNPAGFLQSINRRHEDFRGFKKTASIGGDSDEKSKMSIVMLKVIPNHFVNLMRLDPEDVKAVNAKSEDRRGTGMLTTPEVRAILEKYCKANELIAADATEVTLDGPLTDALYKKSKASAPTTLSRKELNDAWAAKMESAYAVVQMPGSKITKLARGVPPKVQIEVSKRSGRNKFSTRIRGVEEYGIDGDVFCKDVMRRFACSGTIESDEPTMGNLKKGHVEIAFQGHLLEELRALLLGDERLTTHGGVKHSDYSIPKQSISVTLKRGVTAKKSKR